MHAPMRVASKKSHTVNWCTVAPSSQNMHLDSNSLNSTVTTSVDIQDTLCKSTSFFPAKRQHPDLAGTLCTVSIWETKKKKTMTRHQAARMAETARDATQADWFSHLQHRWSGSRSQVGRPCQRHTGYPGTSCWSLGSRTQPGTRNSRWCHRRQWCPYDTASKL